MKQIFAPWSDELIQYLIEYQSNAEYHPFTCEEFHSGDRKLTPTKDGFICKHCDYTQDWCVIPNHIKIK